MVLSALFLKANEIKNNVAEVVENTVDRVLDKHGRKIGFGLIGAMVGNQFAMSAFPSTASIVPNLVCSAIGAVAANKMDARIERQMTNLKDPKGPKNTLS